MMAGGGIPRPAAHHREPLTRPPPQTQLYFVRHSALQSAIFLQGAGSGRRAGAARCSPGRWGIGRYISGVVGSPAPPRTAASAHTPAPPRCFDSSSTVRFPKNHEKDSLPGGAGVSVCGAGGGRERRGGVYRDQGEVRAEYGGRGSAVRAGQGVPES